MKCTTCGFETQPGAKFCVQCGTTIVAASPPAGMAPLAAPSVTSRLAAATPALSSSSVTAATMTRAAYTPPPSAAPTPPAPAAGAPRLGLIAGLLALIAALGIGSFIAYKMLFPAQPKESQATTDTPKATVSPAAQAPLDTPKDGVAAQSNNMTPQQTPAAADTTPPTPPMPAATPTPDTTAKSPTGVPPPPKTTAQTKAASTTSKSAAPTPSAPTTVPAPAPTHQAAAPAAPAPQADRWELMRQAHEVCSRESMFDRLACNYRVGEQYCKGYWGLVPQCPAGAYGDRGNSN
jgi:hypothetical protein